MNLQTTFRPDESWAFDITAVIDYARQKHAGQKRRDGSDYFNHPCGVSGIAANIARDMCCDHHGILIVTAVGYLHDVIEDCGVDFEDVMNVANLEVATLVSWISDDKRLPSEERHHEYIERLTHAPARAKIVKLADIMHNAIDGERLLELDYNKYNKFIHRWCFNAILSFSAINSYLKGTPTHQLSYTNEILDKLWKAVNK